MLRTIFPFSSNHPNRNLVGPHRWLVTVFLLFYLALAAFAQVAPAFLHYTAEDGLPSSECYEILQDREGYIWLSTDNGVSKFDGYAFENFGTKEGLIDKTVLVMKEDFRGWIWMSTFSGNFYIHRGDTIVPYEHNQALQDVRSKFYLIDNFSVDEEGLNVSMKGYMMARIDQRGVLHEKDYPFAKQGYSSVIYDDAEETPFYISKFMPRYDPERVIQYHNQYWLNNIFRLSLFKGAKEHIYHLPANLKHRVFQGTGTRSFCDKTPHGILLQHFDSIYLIPEPGEPAFSVGSSAHHINSISITEQGGYYVGYNLQKGLAYFRNLDELLANQPVYHALDGFSVSHIINDDQGGLWVTTTTNGVFYAAAPENFSLELVPFNSGNNLKVIEAGKNGTLLVGQSSGNIYEIDQQLRAREHSRVEDFASVDDLYRIGDQLLVTSPIKSWNPNTGQWKLFIRHSEFRGEEEGLSIKKLTPSQRANHFWGIYATRGLIYFRYFQNNIEIIEEYSLLEDNKITALAEDAHNVIWVGGMEGLFQFNPASQQLEKVLGNKIFGERVEDITLLPGKGIAVATRGSGIYFIQEEELTIWTTDDGLSSNTISSLVLQNQVLWATSNLGVNRIDLGKGITSNYIFTQKDGLPNNEVRGLSFVKNEAYVLTNYAVTRLASDRIPPVVEVPFLLNEVRVNGRNTSLAALAHLGWQDNNLQLSYHYLDFSQRGNIAYRFKLKEDSDWVNTDNNSLDLLNLNPDEYTLQVEAKDKRGQWIAADPLIISISPPFWKQLWFMVLIALILVLFGYLQFARRLKDLARERERIALEEQVNKLKQQAYRAQMNPHFIFNCMSTIQGMIIGDEEDQQRAVRMIASFSQLIRSALEFSEEEVVSLKDELALLNNYLGLEKLRFNHSFVYQINVHPAIEPDWIQVPPMLVQPFLENAVLHGMEKKRGDGKITVSYEVQEELLKVTIEDNGPGISVTKAVKEKINSKYRHKSLGMTITQRRLDILNQERYQLSIEEPHDEQGRITGTRITLFIPLEQQVALGKT